VGTERGCIGKLNESEGEKGDREREVRREREVGRQREVRGRELGVRREKGVQLGHNVLLLN
jgi:hypothetical protein